MWIPNQNNLPNLLKIFIVNVKKDPRTNILVHYLITIEKKFNFNFEKCFWPNCEGCGNLMPIKYYDTMPEDTTGIECALVKPEFRKTEQSLEIGGIIERKYWTLLKENCVIGGLV